MLRTRRARARARRSLTRSSGHRGLRSRCESGELRGALDPGQNGILVSCAARRRAKMTQTMPAAMDGTTERRTVARSVPRRRSRRFAAAAAVAVVGLLLYSSAAHATPGKSSQWITLMGTCDGIPTVVLDPPGPGPTGFSTLTG